MFYILSGGATDREQGAGSIAGDRRKYDHHCMNAKQRKTLDRSLAQPTPTDVPWSDVESLLRAVSATIGQGAGARVRVALNGRSAVFPVAHPQRRAAWGRVCAVRDFFERAGVTP
jgi:hypothetical protein